MFSPDAVMLGLCLVGGFYVLSNTPLMQMRARIQLPRVKVTLPMGATASIDFETPLELEAMDPLPIQPLAMKQLKKRLPMSLGGGTDYLQPSPPPRQRRQRDSGDNGGSSNGGSSEGSGGGGGSGGGDGDDGIGEVGLRVRPPVKEVKVRIPPRWLKLGGSKSGGGSHGSSHAAARTPHAQRKAGAAAAEAAAEMAEAAHEGGNLQRQQHHHQQQQDDDDADDSDVGVGGGGGGRSSSDGGGGGGGNRRRVSLAPRGGGAAVAMVPTPYIFSGSARTVGGRRLVSLR